MAQTSKRKQQLRRLKRQLSLHERILRQQNQIDRLAGMVRQTQDGAQQARVLLLAALAQKGGEIEVTAGTMQQVVENLAQLNFKTVPNEKDPGAFYLRLVEGPVQAEEQTISGNNGPAVEILTPADEPPVEEPRDVQDDGTVFSGSEDASGQVLAGE